MSDGTDNVSRCPNGHALVSETAHFCVECGAQIQAMDPEPGPPAVAGPPVAVPPPPQPGYGYVQYQQPQPLQPPQPSSDPQFATQAGPPPSYSGQQQQPYAQPQPQQYAQQQQYPYAGAPVPVQYQPVPVALMPFPQPTSQQDLSTAKWAHLGALLAVVLTGGTLGWLVPLIIRLNNGRRSAFVEEHAKEALNYQLTILIVIVIGWLTVLFIIGGVIFLALVICTLVFSISGFSAAGRGLGYRYPICIRMIK